MTREQIIKWLYRITEDIGVAWMLLLRLPWPMPVVLASEPEPSRSTWAYPVIGALVGGVAAMIFGLITWLSMPTAIASGVALAAMLLVTGALHEDGLADVMDSLGGATPLARLEIMRDSRIGAFGTLALIISLGLKWQAFIYLGSHYSFIGFILILAAIGALSRAAMPGLLYALPSARAQGLGASVGKPDFNTIMIGFALSALCAFVAFPVTHMLVLLIILALTCSGLTLAAKRLFGGYTGDVLGATQSITEITLLLAAVSLA